MYFYELATLTVAFGKAPTVLDGIEDFLAQDGANGRLVGCWATDIGELNKLILLREFDDEQTMATERKRCLLDSKPFGGGDGLLDVAYESHGGFPFLDAVKVGDFGPVYELRTYELKLGGLAPTIDAWKAAVPPRSDISPLSVSMYALDGVPRFSHIWPYRSLADRHDSRNKAVTDGVWPPKNGPNWLTGQMRSEILYPTRLSQLK